MPDFSKAPSGDRPEWWTSDEWETPPEIIKALEAEFGHFDLDPCARAETAKAEFYYAIEDDGLAQGWTGNVFVNPPYSAPAPWIRKAHEETAYFKADQVIMLLPAATDVGWFHDLVLPFFNIRFVRGRIKFLGWQGTPIGSPTAGSLIVRAPKRRDSTFHL